jgi:hypothetical protein
MDGRTLGRQPFNQYSSPFSLASIGHQFKLTTAQRWDVLIDTTGAALGAHEVQIEYLHWIRNEQHTNGKVRTRIIVA